MSPFSFIKRAWSRFLSFFTWQFWWLIWLQVCPVEYRDGLVWGWKSLRLFVDAWMRTPPGEPRVAVAQGFLGARGSEVPAVLMAIGSVSLAFQLVTRGRPLTDDERERFATHACPAEKVDWPHVMSGTAGLLGALYMLPQGVSE